MSKKGRAGARERAPVEVSNALRQLFDGLGISRVVKQYDVITQWDELVGAQIARVSHAQRMENGVLYVSVSSAPWRAELTLRRAELLARINTAIGESVVKEIRFR